MTMQSLSYLNGVASSSISFTDNRGANVIFDRPAPINYDFTETTYSFSVLVGINIIDIQGNPNVRYEINLNDPDASLSIGTLPAGVSVNQTGTIYTFSGIDSVSDWEAVKSPTINLVSNYSGSFIYEPTIIYNTDTQSNIRVGYDVGVYVPTALLTGTATIECVPNFIADPITNLNAFATIPTAELTKSGFTDNDEFDFSASSTQSITDTPNLLAPEISLDADDYTITITPTDATAVDTISSSHSGSGFSFNTSTKVVTITGTRSNVNSHLNAMSLVSTSVKTDYNLEYQATSTATELSGVTYVSTQSANCLNLDYLTNPRGTAFYTAGSFNTIGPALPNINDPDYTGAGTYTYTITPTFPFHIEDFTSTGITRWAIDQTENYTDNTIDNYPRTEEFDRARGEGIAFSYDGNYMAVGSRNNVDASGTTDDGKVEIWKLTSGAWSKVQTINGPNVSSFGQNLNFANDSDNTLLVAAPDYNRQTTPPLSGSNRAYGRIYIYKQDTGADTWSEDQILTGAGSSDNFGSQFSISNNGNVMAVETKLNATSTKQQIIVYERANSSSSYSGVSTITDFSPFNAPTISIVVVSPDGSRIAIQTTPLSASYDSFRIYTKPSTSWNNVEHGEYRASGFLGLAFSNDGESYFARDSGSNNLLQSNFNGTTWNTRTNAISLSNTIEDIEMSKDGTKFVIETTDSASDKVIKVYDYNDTTNSFTEDIDIDISSFNNFDIYNIALNEDGTQIIIHYFDNPGGSVPYSNTERGWKFFEYKDRPAEVNPTTKAMTIFGSKSLVNADIETIQVKASSDVLVNIPLTIDLVTPENNTDQKTQNIERS